MQPEQPIVILGSRGMLGQTWSATLRAEGRAHVAVDREECDILDPAALERTIPRGALVINCAAYTNVDQAESEPAVADALNGTAVGLIAGACRSAGATLVHYSTDYVFNGRATTPYRVDHPRDPVNAYGRSKALGEEALERSGADWLLLRTSWLYAGHGKNFVLTIARMAREKPTLRVVNDQRGRPTSCESLVRATRGLLERGARGTLHASDGGECTWFEFASAIVERVNTAGGGSCRVEPCASSEFPRPAARPAYSVFDLSKTEALLGPLPHWSVALGRVLDRAASP